MIERSPLFERDYKRVKSIPHYRKSIDALLSDILDFLLTDRPIMEKYRDHLLIGTLVIKSTK